jgi:hypothetical protein
MSTGNDRLLTSRARGSAMIETVCVLSFILALLFGAAQIVLAGFYQLQLDAATFLYSHSYATTNSIPAAQLQNVVPVVVPTQMTTVATAPPYTNGSDANGLTVLGEYTTGGTPTGSASASTNRYGGASIIRPQQIVTQGTLTLPIFDLSIFSTPPTMTAGNIEGRSMVANHDDDSTGYDYNSAQADGNLVSPDAIGGDDQNVPPYYFPRALMKECPYNGTTGYDNCGGSDTYALGLAEFLQDASYSGAQNGNYSIGGNGIGAGSMFGAMTAHQQVYAALAQTLASPAYSSYAASQSIAPSNNSVVQFANCMNAWDVNVNTISPAGDYGTQYPTFPLATLASPC